MEHVEIIIGMRNQFYFDWIFVENYLEQSGLVLKERNVRCKYLLLETTQELCEQVFNTELEWYTKTIKNLNGPDYSLSQWMNKTPVQTPKDLEEKVEFVELNHLMTPA